MRPTRDELLMVTAETWAKRSTCELASVGCVVSRDGRILVQGYNGAPAGMPHCSHLGARMKVGVESSSCPIAVHAEANAVAHAARHGIRLEGAEVHTTVATCLTCAKLVVNAGIELVVVKAMYKNTEGLELLETAGVAWRMFDGPGPGE